MRDTVHDGSTFALDVHDDSMTAVIPCWRLGWHRIQRVIDDCICARFKMASTKACPANHRVKVNSLIFLPCRIAHSWAAAGVSDYKTISIFHTKLASAKVRLRVAKLYALLTDALTREQVTSFPCIPAISKKTFIKSSRTVRFYFVDSFFFKIPINKTVVYQMVRWKSKQSLWLHKNSQPTINRIKLGGQC
jgi:hypothetical protein